MCCTFAAKRNFVEVRYCIMAPESADALNKASTSRTFSSPRCPTWSLSASDIDAQQVPCRSKVNLKYVNTLSRQSAWHATTRNKYLMSSERSYDTYNVDFKCYISPKKEMCLISTSRNTNPTQTSAQPQRDDLTGNCEKTRAHTCDSLSVTLRCPVCHFQSSIPPSPLLWKL